MAINWSSSMIRRFNVRASLAAFAVVAGTAAAFAAGIGGVYNSSEGVIVFSRLPDGRIMGTYGNDGGMVIGTLQGSRLRGYWMEDSSAVRCDRKRAWDGTSYWGDVEFKFMLSGTIFVGSWDYCGDGAKTKWTGRR